MRLVLTFGEILSTQLPDRAFILTMNPSFQSDQETPQAAMSVSTKSSAVKAGWICLILGFLTFWIFGLGFVFFIATFILAVVAMSTNRLGQGIALLVSSVGSIIVCVIISLALLSSAFTAALKKERARRIEHPTPPSAIVSCGTYRHSATTVTRTREEFAYSQYQHSLSSRVGIATQHWIITRR